MCALQFKKAEQPEQDPNIKIEKYLVTRTENLKTGFISVHTTALGKEFKSQFAKRRPKKDQEVFQEYETSEKEVF